MWNSFKALLWTEGLKIVRSRMFWILLLIFAIVPLICAFFMFILRDPEAARRAGLIGAKASLLGLGQADWPSLWRLLKMVVSQGGIVGFSFVTAWVFGREFSDRTVKDLLVLPLPRELMVCAKFLAMAAWSLLLVLHVFGLSLLAGGLLGLKAWSTSLALESFGRILLATVFVILLSTPVAFFASFGRGFLPPIGFIMLVLILGQVVATIGYAPYFPWAFPAILSGAIEGEHLLLWSYLIMGATVLAGFWGTLSWWRYADQK